MAENSKTTSAQFIFAENTDFNADSVEWCPFSECSQFLTCGTYHLNEGETAPDDMQNRDGNIVLYRLVTDSGGRSVLKKVDTVQSGGVLDLKWCPQLFGDSAVLGAACSNGKLLLYKICAKNPLQLQSFTDISLSTDSPKMVLSLDWTCTEEGSAEIISSDTAGNLNYLKLRESHMCLTESWNAHSFEAWIAAFNYFDPSTVYSGGDDCCLRGWDIRSTDSPTFVSKRHSMGVTAISKSKKHEHLLVTGSYDEYVFLWDTRKMKSPLSEISLGGGIWRLKWHPAIPNYLVSASMHNGFHVLYIDESSNLLLKTHYNQHNSLAYGVDWQHGSKSQGEMDMSALSSATEGDIYGSVIGSCSFYDKSLHLWKIN